MNIDELSGLELRKALLEALGWKGPDQWNGWHAPQCGLPNGRSCCKDCAGLERNLPALEFDPGVFWPMFEKWCKESDGVFDYECQMWVDEVATWAFYVNVDGHQTEFKGMSNQSQLEAGCRAWLKALNG